MFKLTKANFLYKKSFNYLRPMLKAPSNKNFNFAGAPTRRWFSMAKISFIRNLNCCLAAVTSLRVLAKKLVEVLAEMHLLEKKFESATALAQLDETLAFNLKNFFFKIETQAREVIDEEMGRIEDLLAVLTAGPDWTEGLELLELLEDLKRVIALFFSNVELLRRSGNVYLGVKDELIEFPRHNKIFAHTAEIKTSMGLLSSGLKSNSVNLYFILRRVQARWGWASPEQREYYISKFRAEAAEKKKIALERAAERKKQDKIAKEYAKFFRGTYRYRRRG